MGTVTEKFHRLGWFLIPLIVLPGLVLALRWFID